MGHSADYQTDLYGRALELISMELLEQGVKFIARGSQELGKAAIGQSERLMLDTADPKTVLDDQA